MYSMGEGFAGVVSQQRCARESLKSIVKGIEYRGRIKTSSVKSGNIHLAQVKGEPITANGGLKILGHGCFLSQELEEIAALAIEDCRRINNTNGHFAFAIVQPKRERVHLVRDIFGTRPLFYLAEKDFFAFSSDLYSLTLVDYYERLPNHHFLRKYVVENKYDNEATRYKEIKRVDTGSIVTYNLSTKKVYKKEWKKPRKYSAKISKPYFSFRKRLKKLVKRAVKESETFIQVSGGLDSSSIAAISGEVENKTMGKEKYYSITYEDEVPKESHYLEDIESEKGVEIERHSYNSIKKHTRLSSKNLPNDVFYSPFYLMHLPILKEASDGKKSLLLTGIGGDIITGSSFYKKKYYHYLENMCIKRILKESTISFNKRWFFSFVKSFLFSGVVSHLYEVLPLDKKYKSEISFSPFLNSDFKDNLEVSSSAGHPERNVVHSSIYSSLTNSSETLEAIDKIATSHGLKAFHPFQDRGLLDVVLSVDVKSLFYPGQPKNFLKRSMSRHLPNSIITRRTKSGYNLIYRDELERSKDHIQKLLRYGSYKPNYVDEDSLSDFLNMDRYDHVIPALNGFWRYVKVSKWYEEQRFD